MVHTDKAHYTFCLVVNTIGEVGDWSIVAKHTPRIVCSITTLLRFIAFFNIIVFWFFIIYLFVSSMFTHSRSTHSNQVVVSFAHKTHTTKRNTSTMHIEFFFCTWNTVTHKTKRHYRHSRRTRSRPQVKHKQETKVLQSITKFCENGNENRAKASEGFCPG